MYDPRNPYCRINDEGRPERECQDLCNDPNPDHCVWNNDLCQYRGKAVAEVLQEDSPALACNALYAEVRYCMFVEGKSEDDCKALCDDHVG